MKPLELPTSHLCHATSAIETDDWKQVEVQLAVLRFWEREPTCSVEHLVLEYRHREMGELLGLSKPRRKQGALQESFLDPRASSSEPGYAIRSITHFSDVLAPIAVSNSEGATATTRIP